MNQTKLNLPFPSDSLSEKAAGKLWVWVPIIIGLCFLYAPSLYDLFTGIWMTTEQGQGPIVLGVSCWLIYRNWPEMMAASAAQKVSMIGWLFFVVALILYIVGRSQDILLFEIGSVIWMLIAILLLTRGSIALKYQWFALFFMLFMIPLPGSVVDAITLPMKMAVSYVVENSLFFMDYPIARTGVILQIGQYKLLVADACAGLHTLFTLEAIGLLYLNLMRHESVFRNITLAILIIPISFTANVIRVMTLVLITYYFGDEAGQGFLHDFAGIVLFMSALLLIFAVDSGLRLIAKKYNALGQSKEDSIQ